MRSGVLDVVLTTLPGNEGTGIASNQAGAIAESRLQQMKHGGDLARAGSSHLSSCHCRQCRSHTVWSISLARSSAASGLWGAESRATASAEAVVESFVHCRRLCFVGMTAAAGRTWGLG